jgi:hypothetical protein
MDETNSFEKFLEKKKKESEKMEKSIQQSIERVSKWKNEINILYSQIREWVKPFSETISTRSIEFMTQEELTGAYKVEALALRIGKDEIIFQPIGTYMLGSFGRIDINGKIKSFILALTELDEKKPIESKWMIVDKVDRMNRKSFSKNNFESLIQILAQ